MIFRPEPVGIAGLLVLLLSGMAFLVALVGARRRRGPPDQGQGRRSRRSWIGIGVQALGFGAVAIGGLRIVADPWWAPGLVRATAVGLLAGGALWLFVAATRVMGAAWSLEARTRSDHRLAVTGPFARIRHPIYTGMGLFLLALALAYGHGAQLLIGVPLFALGTWLRIREEEALLHARFGEEYDRWAARTRRFVPGVF